LGFSEELTSTEVEFFNDLVPVNDVDLVISFFQMAYIDVNFFGEEFTNLSIVDPMSFFHSFT